jgi:hypothetical protein
MTPEEIIEKYTRHEGGGLYSIQEASLAEAMEDYAKQRSMQAKVLEFHKAFEIKIALVPAIPDEATKQLRIKLIQEEFKELETALITNDIVEVAD